MLLHSITRGDIACGNRINWSKNTQIWLGMFKPPPTMLNICSGFSI